MFKRPMRFDQVVTGQDFGRSFRNPPAMSLVHRCLNMLKDRLPETFECELDSIAPRFEHPLVSGCQTFRVDLISEADFWPKFIAGENERGEIKEDTTLLGDKTVPSSPEARRKYFSKRENLERFYFNPGLLYTFDYYCNFFAPATYSMEIAPPFRIDLIPYFNGYP